MERAYFSRVSLRLPEPDFVSEDQDVHELRWPMDRVFSFPRASPVEPHDDGVNGTMVFSCGALKPGLE